MYSNQKERIEKYKEKIISYYDVVTEPYRKLWGDFFHPAIFENNNDNLKMALLNTHDRFIKDSKLGVQDTAIDLGCGIGSFSCYIAKKVGCKVIGINFSDYQLKKAIKLAEKHNLKDIIFRNIDIMDLENFDKKFNAAFLIDVGCHLPDKEKALINIFNVLKNGGRLVIADWLQKKSPNEFEKELLIEPFNTYWNFPYIESIEGYKKIFKKTGFKIIKADDVSNKTRKNWNIFYKIALREIESMDKKKIISYIKNPRIIKHIGKFESIAKNQFYANVFAKICFDAGVFRYGYFVVER